MGFQDYDGPMTVEKVHEGTYLLRAATADELAAAEAPEDDEPEGAYCACADPECPTPEGAYTHGPDGGPTC